MMKIAIALAFLAVGAGYYVGTPIRHPTADIYPPFPPRAVLADIYPPHPPQVTQA